MIKLFLSNRAETLGDIFAERLRAPVSGIFDPETVLVQARGMERWLSMKIAERNGICANFEFLYPRTFISRMIHAEAELDDERSPFSVDSLRLLVFRLLENNAELGHEFDTVKKYCSDDHSGTRRFQLSGQIASVFEKYIHHRPEMLSDWEAGSDQNNWQAVLWRMIVSEAGGPHPAALMNSFIQKAGRNSLKKDIIPERISIFGISTMPSCHISILEAISDFSDISFYCLSPCSGYWSDIPTRSERRAALRKKLDSDSMLFQETNDLLESLGESLSDFLKIMFGMEKIEEHEFFDFSLEEQADSLLGFIQKNILLLENPAAGISPKYRMDENDDSITIHICHSPMRETEILYDRILDMLEKDHSMNLFDIIVMTPDPDRYMPCVDAVFGASRDSGKGIPYSVSDRGDDAEKKIQDCFLDIMRLGNSRLLKNDILKILENRSVSARFSLDEDDLALIRKWINDVRVSGEIDENHRVSMGLPAFRENSWAYAIDRFLLGIAMQDEDVDSFCGISPYSGITTSNYTVLSDFLGFWKAIYSAIGELRGRKTPDEWADYVSGILDVFFDDRESASAKRNIRKHVFRFRENASATELSERISSSVVTDFLSEAFNDSLSSFGFLTGGVTFCAMLPMRSIPFRVICLLGMNSSSFPRNIIPQSFDITIEKPKPGDPSIRKDDRQLFLDIIVSAREKLYISCTGQSSRDNSVIPPSVVVSELIDYIENSCEPDFIGSVSSSSSTGINTEIKSSINAQIKAKISDRIIIRHPVHGFSPSSFKTGSDIFFSYNREYFEAARAITARSTIVSSVSTETERYKSDFWPEPLESPEHSEIDKGPGQNSIIYRIIYLGDFKRFWKNPCEFAVKNRLGVNLDIPGADREITGAYLPEALDRYGLFNRNIELKDRAIDVASRHNILKSQGFLPHGKLGDMTHAIYEKEALEVEAAAGADSSEISEISIDISVAGFTIYGSVRAVLKIDDDSGNVLILTRYSRIDNAKTLLDAWIDYLVCIAAGCGADSCLLVGFEDSKTERSVSSKVFGGIESEDAVKYLELLLEFYSEGLARPLPFLPELSKKYADKAAAGADEIEIRSEIEKYVNGSYNQTNIIHGYYEELCFGENMAEFFFNSDDFRRISIEVFAPLSESMKINLQNDGNA